VLSSSLKGYVFNLKRYAVHDGPGIRTTIFMQGCPMHCVWCHNPESQPSPPRRISRHPDERNCIRPFYRPIPYKKPLTVTVDELFSEIRKDRIFYEESDGGVTFSGGEPFMQSRFLKEMLYKCQQDDIHTAVDTSGFVPLQLMQQMSDLIDLFLFDLKFINDDDHIRYTGLSNERILKNLEWLIGHKKPLAIRIPLIPAITDTQENLTSLAIYLQDLDYSGPIDLLPYNPMGEVKYKKLNQEQKIAKLKHQSDQELNRFVNIFSGHGFQVRIGG
jgi:pyruvate formate lyase activating enzyme